MPFISFSLCSQNLPQWPGMRYMTNSLEQGSGSPTFLAMALPRSTILGGGYCSMSTWVNLMDSTESMQTGEKLKCHPVVHQDSDYSSSIVEVQRQNYPDRKWSWRHEYENAGTVEEMMCFVLSQTLWGMDLEKSMQALLFSRLCWVVGLCPAPGLVSLNAQCQGLCLPDAPLHLMLSKMRPFSISTQVTDLLQYSQ